MATTEVRFQDISITANLTIGARALPSLTNDLINMAQARISCHAVTSARSHVIHCHPCNCIVLQVNVTHISIELQMTVVLVQAPLAYAGVSFANRKPFQILQDMSGVLLPVCTAQPAANGVMNRPLQRRCMGLGGRSTTSVPMSVQ